MNARFRALARRRDAGVTLVELMVAVVVAAIVLALVAGFFVQSVRITTASNSSRQTNDISTNAANRVTSWVRAVTQTPTTDGQKQSILVAKPQYLQFYSFADTNAATPVISKVTIEVVSSQIRISSCPGVNAAGTSTWSFTCTAANTKVQTMVGTVVAPTGSQLPLFTYFPSSVTGNYDTTPAANSATATNALGGGGELSAADIKRVTSIGVSLKLKMAGSADASADYVTNLVGLPNIAFIQRNGSGS